MEIPKPSEADKQFFRGLIPDQPDVEIKPMFGNLGAFVHGNMFAWRTQPGLAADWVAKALAHVSSMPPKVKKPKPAKRKT